MSVRRLPLATALLSAAALASTAMSTPARAQDRPPVDTPYQAITFDALDAPLYGNQAFGGAFGIDFDVGAAPVFVRGLAAFDDGQDGFNAPITIRLYDRSAQALFASTVFTPGTGARLSGGYRITDLATALLLPAGFRGSVVASGYGTTREQLYNSSLARLPGSITTAGFVTFVGAGRYSFDANAFPTIVDGGQPVHYAGPNFVLSDAANAAAAGAAVPVSTAPEPATWALVGAGLVMVGAAARRARTTNGHA
ncbi:MAG TPA: PEP-CTERM sorting domain-containing protein [Gemmatirosa sp.]